MKIVSCIGHPTEIWWRCCFKLLRAKRRQRKQQFHLFMWFCTVSTDTANDGWGPN